MTVLEIYPRVFLENKRQTVFLRIEGEGDAEIKIQPMEIYAIKHGTPQKLHEEERYAYSPLTSLGGGLYSFEYDFQAEQRYTLRVKSAGAVIHSGYLYAIGDRLAALRPYKGEMHCHSNRSDGACEPFELMTAYLGAGFDFATLTDHHKYAPSVEVREQMASATDIFTVIKGEEVHNKGYGYYHAVNFGGKSSVNYIIENDEDYVTREVERIKAEHTFPDGVCPQTAAYRIFISEHIRRAGGVSILSHPYWDAYGEYNTERPELIHLLRTGAFDALEIFAGNDVTGNGDNLEIAVWTDLLREGITTSLVGVSDTHSLTSPTTRFNKNFTIVFASCEDDLCDAVREGRCVAVKRRDDVEFLVLGNYPLVAYARFLLAEMYPTYATLTSRVAEEIGANGGEHTDAVRALEADALAYRRRFFADGINV